MGQTKKLIVILILLVLITPTFVNNRSYLTSSFNRWINYSFCDRPIKYRINSIDPKFGISETNLLAASKEAANIWNRAWEHPLFEADEKGDLQINLVYDERQTKVNLINNLGNSVGQQKQKIADTTKQYQEMRAELEKEIKNLNEAIDYWNKHGGISEAEYNRLTKAQKDVNERIRKLDEFGSQINKNVEKVNQTVNTLNTNVQTFNNLISVQPEEGSYTSGVNKIEIYFYGSHQELVHVLAHEFGHSLGIWHVEEQNAVMNPVTSPNNKLTEADLQALTTFCSHKNRFDLIKHDITNIIYSILSKFASKGK